MIFLTDCKTLEEYCEKKTAEYKANGWSTVSCEIEFYNDAVIQGFLSFDVINHQTNFMDFYGTKGSLIGPDPNMFGGPIKVSLTEGGEWKEYSTEEMKLGKTNIFNESGRSNEAPTNANYRGVGLSDMIYSIENKREHRCNGELALHVLDIIESAMISSKTKQEVNLRSTCRRPNSFDDQEIKKLLKN